ncbi:MAG: hypothetical protein EAX86_06815 [Candidatus Heimdallarchaeota archaeon]|nr:hypothetical protein [Candidatus Heimdallarchaeota archaeon]
MTEGEAMKATVWTKYGSPDGLQFQEVKKPTPMANEVLIKVKAVSVMAGDCEMRSLKMTLMLGYPMRLYTGIKRPQLGRLKKWKVKK